MTEHGARAHAELGASSCARWTRCPASIRRLRHLPAKAGLAAERGTAVHEIAEAMLLQRLLLDRDQVLYGFHDDIPLSHYIGEAFNGMAADEDLVECAQAYVNECLMILQPGDRVWIERKFSLAVLDPPDDMFGTADLVVYRPSTRRLIVIDLKSGAGVVVYAENNLQLRYYGLGAMLSLPGLPIDDVEMIIIQPRVADPVKTTVIDPVDLFDWSAELLDAARATLAEDAPAVAGEHCRFCGAKPGCDAYEVAALAAARDEFDVIEGAVVSVAMPDPAGLSADALAWRLTLVPLLEDWVRTMKALAYQRLSRRESIPGFKLVNKNARRKWRDDEDAVAWLFDQGIAEYDVYQRTIISPAQAEKLVADKKALARLVTTESSGLTVVPDTDKRPAVTVVAAEDEFDIIEDDN